MVGLSHRSTWRVCVLLVLAVLSAVSTAQNLVVNPNFAVNATSYGSNNGGVGAGSNPAYLPAWAFDWAGALGIGGTDPNATLLGPSAPTQLDGVSGQVRDYAWIYKSGLMSQSVKVLAPNTTYRLSIDVARRAGETGTAMIKMVDGGTTYVSDSAVAGINANEFHRLIYFFTTGSTVNNPQIQLQNTSNPSLNYSVCFANVSVTPANLLQNGDFSANAALFTTYPGYVGGSNPANITNWSFTGTSGWYGINTQVGGQAGGDVFGLSSGLWASLHPNASPGDASVGGGFNAFGPVYTSQVDGVTGLVANYAFIQGNGTIYQAATLRANTNYRFTVDAAQRAWSGGSASVSVVGASTTYVNDVTPLGVTTSEFHRLSYVFKTGTSDLNVTVKLSGSASAGQDLSVDFANATLVPLSNIVTNGDFSSNGYLYRSGAGADGSPNPTSVVGWTDSAPAVAGVNGIDTGLNWLGPTAPTVTDGVSGQVRNYHWLQWGTTQTSQSLNLAANSRYRYWIDAAIRSIDTGSASLSVKDGSTTLYSSGLSGISNAQFHRLTDVFSTPATLQNPSIVFTNGNVASSPNSVVFSNLVVLPVPNPPSLTATPGANQVSLAWTAGSDATAYTVKRATTASGPFTIVSLLNVATGWTDTGLTNGSTYYYKVSASNGNGEGPDSAVLSIAPGFAPPAPTNLTAAGGVAQVTLAWSASSGASSYTVKRSTTNGGPYTAIASGVTATTYANTGLTNGTTYYYVVSAVNGSGESANSNQASATPQGLPAAPSNLTASPGNAQVTLSWAAANGATSYKVRRSTTSGGSYSDVATGVTGTTYVNSGLTNGTTYYYVVVGTNSSGDGPSSNQASARPLAAPAAPTGVSATPGDHKATVTWTASTDAASYTVKKATSTGGPYTPVQSGITGTAFDVTNLAKNTPYFFVVTASNVGGESNNSSEVSATPYGVPDAPEDLKFFQDLMSWAQVPDATSYAVKRSTVSGGPYTELTHTVTGTSFTDSSAIAGQTYYYVVSASNTHGTGPDSAEISHLVIGRTGGFAITKLTDPSSHLLDTQITVTGCRSFTDSGVDSFPSGSHTWATSSAYYLCTNAADPIASLTEDQDSYGFLGLNHQSFTLDDSRNPGHTVTVTGVRITSDPKIRDLLTQVGHNPNVFLVYRTYLEVHDRAYNGAGQTIYVYDNISNVAVTVQREDYSISSNSPTVLSLDSRKTYGQPNLDGETPADPNAELRNPSFLNWQYRGGLFVGNAGPNSRDKSGTARLQGYMPSTSFTDPVWSILSLIYVGAPSQWTSPPSLKCMFPATDDPNLGTTPGTCNWSNAWSLAMANSRSTFATDGLAPFSRVSLQFPGYSPKFLVALDGESDYVSQGSSAWCYFARTPYSSPAGSVSGDEAVPKMIVVDRVYRSGQ